MATIVRRQLFITPHHSFSRPPLHVFRLHYSFSAPQGSFLAPPTTRFQSPLPNLCLYRLYWPSSALHWLLSASTGRLLPPPPIFCFHRPFSASATQFLPLPPIFIPTYPPFFSSPSTSLFSELLPSVLTSQIRFFSPFHPHHPFGNIFHTFS